MVVAVGEKAVGPFESHLCVDDLTPKVGRSWLLNS